MPNISIIDETFDENISSSYYLSIQFSLDGFCFCTLDPIRNKYIQFQKQDWSKIGSSEVVLNEFKAFYDSNSILKLPFRKVFILIDGSEFSLVPSVLFSTEKLESIYSMSHTKNDIETLLYNRLKLIDSYLIFPANRDLIKSLQSYFVSCELFHTNSISLEAISLTSKSTRQKNSITVSFTNNGFDLFAFTESNLVLANHFDYKTDVDFIYYFLFVVEQLKFSNDNMELFIIGDVEYDSKLILLLKQYVKRLSFKQVNKSFSFSYLFKDIPQYSKFSLYNVPLCVS